MLKWLKIPVMLILLPAFLLAATGFTMYHHTCSMCEVDEYVAIIEVTSCCSDDKPVADASEFSCCATGEESCNHECCNIVAEYYVSEENLFPPTQKFSLYPVLIPQDIYYDLAPVADIPVNTSSDDRYWQFTGYAGKDLLVLIHQLKLHCFIS
jgi:hypothetical protein